VFEARERLGGRVWTARAAPLAPFHAELGGELVDKEHHAIRSLCKEFGLGLKPILLRGFGLAIGDGRRVRTFDSQTASWRAFQRIFASRAKALSAVQGEWVSSIAGTIARESIEEVLDAARAGDTVRAHAVGLRNFWMADPDRLSALVAATQANEGDPSQGAMYHVVGGNDQIIERLARDSGDVRRRHAVRAVEWTERGVSVSVEGPNGRRANANADYLVLAVPVALLQDIKFTPGLPPLQQHAIASLETGPATKAILRFDSPWWRRPGQPRAYGSNLAVGAVWDAGEDQAGAATLTLLAGGRASAALQSLLARQGASGIARQLQWMNGGTRELPRVHAVCWENDPWARGAYAFFSPRFDPALRPLLARAAGRVFFAGCHTSRNFQGYMNGAVESGLRVVSEIAATHRL
jgi:monoamine oxidase